MAPDSLQFNKGAAVEYLENSGKVTHRGLINEDLVRAENEDKTTPYLIFLILVAAVAGFFGIVGSALPLVGEDLGHALSYSEQEIITAGTTIGAVFGALILGWWSDKAGRKMAMVVSDIAFTLGAVIIASSYSVPQIIVGRLVLGVGVGGASVIAPLYIAEMAPTAVRGRCVGINGLCIPLGQIVASSIAAGVGPNVRHGWRLLFALGVVPSIVQLCLMHWLPESPRINIIKGKREEAIKTLRLVYNKATDEILALKLRIIEDNLKETTRLQSELTLGQMVKKLWTHAPYRRAIISVSAVQALGQLNGYNALLYYSSTIFGLIGFKNSAAAGIIPAAVNAFFVLVGLNIVDRVGRRRLLVIAIPGMLIGLVWAAVAFHYLTKSTGGFLVEGAPYPQSIAGCLIGGIVFFVACFGISLSFIPWYQSEFLALEIRAAGSAVSSTALWLSNLVISVSYLSMLNNMTPSGTYGLYAGWVLIGYMFIYLCYPETKGLSIDETEHLFKDGFGVQRSVEMRAEKAAYRKAVTHARELDA
ncbi:MFS transporter, SP family, solute carrier family 2 (myo-inositol transporter), member 13 [Pseudohyphozyma bogoriensis]|nr:MFS transporter, SP family, solute carrier family 2 (myo-inositol transporter), member 13 [Pseudohyphozyma bogoriensis]